VQGNWHNQKGPISHLPLSSPSGLSTESEIGVGKNCSCELAARLVKVLHKLRARLWIFAVSMESGARKEEESRDCLVVAIERGT